MLVLLLSLAAVLSNFAPAAEEAVPVSVAFDGAGRYTVSVGSTPWYRSAPLTVCQAGRPVSPAFTCTKPASGADAFGEWTGTTASFAAAGTVAAELTFNHYPATPQLVVGTARLIPKRAQHVRLRL